MKPSHRALVIPVVVFALASFSRADAQEGTRLAKADVEGLTSGKELKYERADGTVVTWDFRKDGTVYFTPRTQRSVVIGGTYTVDDDGSLCLKWREDKFVQMTDGCYVFTRVDDTTRISGKRNPARVIGTLQ